MADRTKPRKGTNPSGAKANARRKAEAQNRANRAADPEAATNAAVANLVGPHGQGASALSNHFYAPESLGRVSSGFNPDGSRIFENQDILDRLAGIRDVYGIPGKNRSAELSDNMSSLKSQAQGYTAPEYQAFREQQRRGTESAYKTQDAATNRSIARNRLSGSQAAVMKNLVQRNRSESQARNEQDLFLKSADEKYSRTRDYGNTIRDVEDTEYGRMRETGADYADRLDSTRKDELSRQLVNLDQVAAERAGQAGTYFGAINLGEQRDSARRGEKLARDIYNISKPKGRGRGDGRDSGGSSGGTGTTKPAFDYNSYLDAVKGVYSR